MPDGGVLAAMAAIMTCVKPKRSPARLHVRASRRCIQVRRLGWPLSHHTLLRHDSETPSPPDPVNTEIASVRGKYEIGTDLLGQHHNRGVRVVHRQAGLALHKVTDP